MKVLEGKLVAGKGKFAIVASRFNEFIVSKLISGAEDTLVRHGVDTDDITLVWVPGAFEIPLAKAQSLQAFADFAWSVIHQIENNLLENERLTALRDSLLPKLMSGEIDVSDIQL